MKTIGQNIAYYRKAKGFTQENLAEICNVSPQAVSKWENDIACPDITLLKGLARTFGISVDELLDDGEGPVTKLSETAKGILLKIRIVDKTDKVSVNLPVALIELLLQNEQLKERVFSGEKSKRFASIDFKQVLELISFGVIGKLVEIEAGGDERVEVWVE